MSSLKEWSVAFPRGACSLSHMDKVLWKSELIPVKGRGLLNIPEIALPTPQTFPFSEDTTLDDSPEQEAVSPTLSIDSGRSTGTSLWPSSKYFVHGGPGFSIGVLDSTTGTIDHLPIPFPTTQMDMLNSDTFCTSEVTCMALVGESQLWAGTESGSLHAFELSPGLRLTKHNYCKLPECICCLKTDTLITSKYFTPNGRRSSQGGRLSVSKSEVMVGSSNGTLTILSGEANDRGSLLNIGKCPRKVVHLGDGRGCCRVQCIALVSSMGADNCWCGCGSRIIILQRSNWKVLARLDAMVGFPLEESEGDEEDDERSWMDLQVRHLEPTEDGVWSSMEHSPAVVLWDTKYFSPKLKISCV